MIGTASAFRVVCLSALVCLGVDARGAVADRRVRTAQQALDAAQTKLSQAQQRWSKAQQDLATAQAAAHATSNKLHQARQTAAQQHGADIGMTAAVSERDSALRQINTRRKTIE